ALGRFKDVLRATAQSPAMLFYLDNWLSAGPNSVAGRLAPNNRRGKANENYARELMELHTLGVDGGYTQRDVQEVARCFTGWTIKQHWWRGHFDYDAGIHDPGEKQVLGHRIRGRQGADGEREGEEVLDLLVAHPSTARYVSRKFCRRFIADDPPPSAVAPVAIAFQRSGGDVAETLRALFLTPEFRSGDALKMK